MGRIYRAPMPAVAVTVQQDFFEITSPADAITTIHEVHLSQSTEVGDAMEEQLLVLFKTGATSTGTGGTQAITVTPNELGDAAYGGVVDINNTTKATGGTIVTHEIHSWNVRVPFDRILTPETRIVISPSARFTVELGTTPGDSVTVNGFVVFEEIGG